MALRSNVRKSLACLGLLCTVSFGLFLVCPFYAAFAVKYLFPPNGEHQLIFTTGDPGDDGDNTEEKGVASYPNGPARQPSSVQRGSTQFLSIAPGDP